MPIYPEPLPRPPQPKPPKAEAKKAPRPRSGNAAQIRRQELDSPANEIPHSSVTPTNEHINLNPSHTPSSQAREKFPQSVIIIRERWPHLRLYDL